MARPRTLLVGDPIIHDRTLQILQATHGKRRGFEVYKGALVVRQLGWYGVVQALDRRTALKLRNDLVDAGCLGGVYEDDVSLDEMARHILEMQA